MRIICTKCGRTTYHPIGSFNIFDEKHDYTCTKCMGLGYREPTSFGEFLKVLLFGTPKEV